MRLSRTSIQKAVASVAVGSGLVAAGAASAGVVYDLRFTDGSNTKTVSSAGTYTVDLWAVVSGTNGSTADDGIQSGYFTVLSTQSGGGAIANGGGMTEGAVTTDFQSFSGTNPLYKNGTGSDLNGDGIIDWGSTSTAQADNNYLLARAGGFVLGGGAQGGNSVDSNTWEFKLATYTVNVGALGTGTTSFNVVKPSWTSGLAGTYSAAQVDGAHFNVATNNQQGAYTNSIGVSFVAASGGVTPEPASLSLLGVAAIGLLGRRRK